MNLVERANEITVASWPEFPTNKGGLCQKGWTSADLLRHPERLTTPLMRDRKGEPLRPVSWDVALDRAAREIVAVQEKHGRDAVGVFGGGGLTNEKAYTLGKFARVALRTAMIDYNGRFCMSSAASAGIKAFGVDRGMPFPLEDIPKADVILLIGSNAAETMPPIMQYFEAQRQRGGKLIVVDPRWTPTAQSATLHLQITPGTDLALANGLLHIAARDNLLDTEFIKTRTSNFPAMSRVLASCWPEHIERITGVSMQQMTRAASRTTRASPTNGSRRRTASSGPAPPRIIPVRRACFRKTSRRRTGGRASIRWSIGPPPKSRRRTIRSILRPDG
jgi:assimilatory nitrate reductase catalytic subunit